MIDYILCFLGGLTIGVIVGMFRMAFYYDKKAKRINVKEEATKLIDSLGKLMLTPEERVKAIKMMERRINEVYKNKK